MRDSTLTSASEDGSKAMFMLPFDFPLEYLAILHSELNDANIYVPGFIPSSAGVFNTDALLHEASHGTRTVLLPDRNVVSRMAQLADGRSIEGNEQLRLAAALLGVCQCFNIEVESSVAFHELAHKSGNDVAWEELTRFRLSDSALAHEAIAVAMRRRPVMQLRGQSDNPGLTSADLAKPLRRWNRNYIIALKILELEEEQALTPLSRVLSLMDWMASDFMFGAPGALLAMVYLAPNSSPKKRVFKDRNSADREAALAGVRNAAWDLTHLSDFIERVNKEGLTGKTRFIFASFDRHLLTMARLIFSHGTEESSEGGFTKALAAWWPEQDAARLNEALFGHLGRVAAPTWKREVELKFERIQALIREGEDRVRAMPRGSRA